MNSLAVLYGGRLFPAAFEKVFNGKSALNLALERVRLFPGVGKVVLLGAEGTVYPDLPPGVELVSRPNWTRKGLLETLSNLGTGFDLTFFAWADCPFLDPALAAAIAERHVKYAAEYSYADGWPYGFAPELLSPGTAGILTKITEEDESPVERDSLFAVLQKDINAFDIETEISTIDLRSHRLSLSADSKRNLLLLTRFAKAAGTASGIPAAADAAEIIASRPEILRTLPNFYPIQVSASCPQSCAICPYSQFAGNGKAADPGSFLEIHQFEALLDRISAFSGDAVIDLSLWGEISLHPRRLELIKLVLDRPELSLIIETSGVGWKNGDFEAIADLAAKAALAAQAAAVKRGSILPPLSWIVSLDTADPQRYQEIRGPGFAEAVDCAKKLLTLFPKDAYVQAVRTAGAEDDIEKFYRSWKEAAPNGSANIIIQKYDDFCGALPKKQASDLSPVQRQPCWHLMRDIPILLDGTVPLCREDLSVLKGGPQGLGERILGNAFSDSLEIIWERGAKFYEEHCRGKYTDSCAGCDEYYTYNF
ncbi:spiro-SPASM protein [Spirochaetia bacterium]|nr:spiro-SPASM protein [Spirochaetia bacterium]